MGGIKFNVFDDDDLKALETTLMKALVRAFRQIAREGLIPGLPAPAAEAGPSPAVDPVSAPQRPAAAPPRKPSIPEDYSPARPRFDIKIVEPSERRLPEDPVRENPADTDGSIPTREPITPVIKPEVFGPPWPGTPVNKKMGKPKEKRRSIRNVAKVQVDRPFGYVTTQDAAKLMTDMTMDQAITCINVWALDREIPSVICTSEKPPTKGLPGRLMVDKAELIKRNDTRKRNAALPPRMRQRIKKYA